MQQKRKGIPMIVIGIIMVVVGIGLIVTGNIIDNNEVGHIKSYYNYGHRNDTGTIMSGFGIAFVVVGAILVILGIVFYVSSGSRGGVQGQRIAAPAVKFNGRFTNLTHTYWVELEKDGTCIWSQQNKLYEGFYRNTDNNEWTIYIDGFGEAFKFSVKGEDIWVKGGPVNEIFFCEVRI